MESAELEGCCCSIRINPREREGRGVRDILSRKGEDFFGLGNFGYCQEDLLSFQYLFYSYLPTYHIFANTNLHYSVHVDEHGVGINHYSFLSI